MEGQSLRRGDIPHREGKRRERIGHRTVGTCGQCHPGDAQDRTGIGVGRKYSTTIMRRGGSSKILVECDPSLHFWTNMKIFKATRKYESWLRKNLDVFEDDLALKAQLLAKDPFTFLRGTFYRWMQLFPEVCKKAADAPVVLSVGDLHAANFGTWRDAKEDLIWGINDFDEAANLPYTQDLIRLASSVELASETDELQISLEEACQAILDGYRDSLEKSGKPIVIDEDRDWL